MHAGAAMSCRRCANASALSVEDLRYSARILDEYGNMSSAFVYFVLKSALEDNARAGMVVDVGLRRGFQLSRRAAFRGSPRVSAAILTRRVEAETLDHLREDDPRAIRSRGDLRRINRIMGNVSIVDSLLKGSRSPVRRHGLPSWEPAMARCYLRRRPASGAMNGPDVALTFVDQQDLCERADARGVCGSRLDGARRRHGCLRLARTPGSSALRRHRRESLRAPFRGRCLVALVPRNCADHRTVSSRASRGERELRCSAAILSVPWAPMR